MRSLVLTLFACTAAAQQAAPVLPAKFRVPLHTAPADPLRGAYGLWAVGDDYKASFHDGFRVYPRLGRSAPRNLPLAWQTSAVLSGSRPLFEQADRRGVVVSDWRYEYRHPGVSEAYDLRADGVEQSFTVQSVPAVNADLTVVGTIDTLLQPQAQSWGQAVVFADENRVARLTVGAARATDARGRNVPVQRTWDRGQLRLRVLAADLAALTFPVVFTQLVTSTELLRGNEYSDVGFARWDEDGYIAVTCHWSAADADGYGFKVTNSWVLGTFWADVSAEWSTERVRMDSGPYAFVRVAGQRTHSAPALSEVFVYHQQAPAWTADVNQGMWTWVPATAGYTQRNPEIDNVPLLGGITLTWQEDFTEVNANTATTRICAAPSDGLTNSFPVKWIVVDDPLLDAEDATMRAGYVFWQQQPSDAMSPPQIMARAMDFAGPTALPPVHVSVAHAGLACRHPRLGVIYPEFVPTAMCSYEFEQGAEHGIAAVKFTGGAIVSTHEVWRATQTARLHDVLGFGIAHWYVLYERAGVLRGTRLGHTGGTVAEFLIDSGSAACACLGRPWGPWPTPVLFARAASPDLMRFSTLTFSPLAHVAEYGSDCGSHLSKSTSGGAFAGGELVLSMTGPAAGAPCQLMMAAAPGSTPIMGGCTLLLDPTAVVLQTFLHSGPSLLGHVLHIPLADDPVFFGNLYFQVLWANPAMGWVTRATNGIEAHVH